MNRYLTNNLTALVLSAGLIAGSISTYADDDDLELDELDITMSVIEDTNELDRMTHEIELPDDIDDDNDDLDEDSGDDIDEDMDNEFDEDTDEDANEDIDEEDDIDDELDEDDDNSSGDDS